MDKTGAFQLGKRPKAEPEANHYSKAAAAEPELNPMAHWRRLPVAVRAVVVLAVMAGTAVVGFKLANRARLNVPDDLIGRGKFAADAILKGDNARLDAVAAPGTAEKLEAWADKVRGLCVEKGIGADAGLWVEAGRPDSRTHSALVTVMIIPPMAAPAEPAGGSHAQRASLSDRKPPSATDRSLSIRLYWTQDDGGQWLLDGEHTPDYNRPPPTSAERRST